MTDSTRVDALRGLEHEIVMLLRRVRRQMGARAQLVHPELNGTAYSLLAALIQMGPHRASEIADAFGLDKGTVSRLVHQLESIGLIIRTPDPDDGRASILDLTLVGRERMEAATELRRAEFAAKLADWEAAELQQLGDGLAKYNSALAD